MATCTICNRDLNTWYTACRAHFTYYKVVNYLSTERLKPSEQISENYVDGIQAVVSSFWTGFWVVFVLFQLLTFKHFAMLSAFDTFMDYMKLSVTAMKAHACKQNDWFHKKKCIYMFAIHL